MQLQVVRSALYVALCVQIKRVLVAYWQKSWFCLKQKPAFAQLAISVEPCLYLEFRLFCICKIRLCRVQCVSADTYGKADFGRAVFRSWL